MSASPSPAPTPDLELVRQLGKGRSSTVWHAILREPLADLPAGAEVAVKVLLPELERDAHARAAFDAEAELGKRHLHPGLMQVFFSGESGRGRELVMELVPGRSLAEELATAGASPEPLVRSIGRQLASALAALHSAGWVHGDLKPENVRLDAEGRAVLVDLGFARPWAAGEGSHDGAQAGTPAYLAPEQVGGAARTPSADVFALGVLLHELATGRHPFLDATSSGGGPPDAAHLLQALREAQPPLPSHTVPELSPFFDRLISQVLSRDPTERPTAAELERTLNEGESGAWWRERVDFDASARRATVLRAESHLVPFAGREQPVAELIEAFAGASRPGGRGGGVLWLTGEPGSGKSRLVSEFVARVRGGSSPPLYLYGRCSEWQEEQPAEAVRSLLRRWLHLPRETPPGPRERAALLELVPPAIAATLAALADPDRPDDAEVAPTVALARWLVELARARPLVAFLDDFGWAGPATIEVFSELAQEIAGTRLFLVFGLREGESVREPAAFAALRAKLAARTRVHEIALAPLAEQDVLAAVDALFSEETPKLGLAHALHQRSRGNPGLLGEILRALKARGEVRPARGEEQKLELTIAPDAIPRPRSGERLVVERLRGLSEPARRWLERLAVLGGHFDPERLALAFPQEADDVERVLADLGRAGWLVAVGSRYRFARPAQREAVYASIPLRRRRAWHAAFARYLAAQGDGASTRTAFQRAWHLHEAGEHAELVDLSRELVGELAATGPPRRVHTLATWGLEALEELPGHPERDRLRVVLLASVADAADRLGDREVQRQALDRLAELDLDPDREPVEVGRIYLLYGRLASHTGRYGLARGALHNAAQLFEKAGKRELASDALCRLAHVQTHVGELVHARRAARRALSLSKEPLGKALARLALGVVAVLENRIEASLSEVDRALALLEGDRARAERGTAVRGARAAAYLQRARALRLAGRPWQGFAAIQRARRLAREAGERRLETEAEARLGRLYMEAGFEHEAELWLRESLADAREIEYRRGEALALVFLGSLHAEAEREGADLMLTRAGTIARELTLARVEALALALRARLALLEGDTAAALEHSERAQSLVDRVGSELPEEIVVVATRCLALRRTGRETEAELTEQRLRREATRQSRRLRSPVLRRRHAAASAALLASALSGEGPLWPRTARIRPRES